jgi:hypothetical protein
VTKILLASLIKATVNYNISYYILDLSTKFSILNLVLQLYLSRERVKVETCELRRGSSLEPNSAGSEWLWEHLYRNACLWTTARGRG